MKYDIVLSCVGGQGGISISVVIAKAAMAAGLHVKQSEVHGMAQRGGQVHAHLRISDKPIASPLIPEGGADLVLAFEPLEALRYLPWMSAKTRLVAASEPFVNIADYPPLGGLLDTIRALPVASTLVEAERLAREAGNARAANVVLVGAAARFMPLSIDGLKNAVSENFAAKGEAVVAVNLKAFELGREAALA